MRSQHLERPQPSAQISCARQAAAIRPSCPAPYLLGLAALLAARYLYRLAGAPQLRWILGPTAWWVQTLGRIPFLWDPRLGYVSHPYRFILAPSCSGVLFMLIAAATLFFSFLHRMAGKKEKLIWTVSSLAVSYLFTVLINSLRIILSVYLPLLLEDSGIFQGWLTKERFHTIIGVLVYFPSLLLLYLTADRLLHAHPCTVTAARSTKLHCRFLPPVFWYFSIVLGVPFLGQAHQTDSRAFWSYALLVVVLCLAVLLLFVAVHCVRKCYQPPAPAPCAHRLDTPPDGAQSPDDGPRPKAADRRLRV